VYPSGHASKRGGRLGNMALQSCHCDELVLHRTVRIPLQKVVFSFYCHGHVPAKGYTCPDCCRVLNFAVSIVLLLGAPITRYLYTVPYMVTLPLHLAHTTAFWWWGPMTSHSKLFRITLPIAVLGFSTPHIVGFAGPIEHAPFGNQLIFTAVLAIWFFTR
jgi:hypothetical protein